jgi:ABC-2 type transport system permease protein
MLAVFKRDFRAYFTSAIGYVYLGAFIFVLNLSFYQDNILRGTSSVAWVFNMMLTVMIFLTPILTMRVFSEEYKQKTDQLLFTAPVKPSAVVLGKYLSSLMVFVCLLALTLLWPLVISIFGENNMAEVLGNYFGMLAIGSAYIAVGVYISSLTEHQVVAAVSSLGAFISLMLFENIAIFFPNIALPVFVNESISFVSLYSRYHSITRGILSLDDIVYFLSLSALFIYLTVRSLEKRRRA